jgi:hypothetical protein
VNIETENCENAYKNACKELVKEGKLVKGSSGKDLYETLGARIRIEKPADFRKPLEIIRRRDEFIYPRMEELELVSRGKLSQTNFAKRLYDFEGLNQLDEFVIPLLKTKPTTKRAITVNYDPKLDSIKGAKSAISIVSFYFKLEEEKLHLVVYMRSLDCFLGLPANFVHSGSVQQYVCEKLRVKPGNLTILAANAHLYRDFETLIPE